MRKENRNKSLLWGVATLVFSALLLQTFNTYGAESESIKSLEEELKSLDVANQAPAIISKEKLYSVQERYLPLKFKSEVSVGGARNFSGSSFLSTTQLELGYRFHFSNRISLGAMYSFVSNKFTESAMTLQNQSGYVPDVSYVSRKMELTAAYNLFYGKFRVTTDTVYYFDQYWALGAGRMDTGLGQEWAAVADAGLVLWLGKWGSARLGLKDYYYNEKTLFNSSMAHNLHGHLDVGYLF